jgi:hypothetical protein
MASPNTTCKKRGDGRSPGPVACLYSRPTSRFPRLRRHPRCRAAPPVAARHRSSLVVARGPELPVSGRSPTSAGPAGGTPRRRSRAPPAWRRGAVRMTRASSSSDAPRRSGPRRSLSSRREEAVAQLAVRVSRTRSQAPQNGRLTEPMTPTRPGPPSTSQVSAGALPRSSLGRARGRTRLRSRSRISSASTMASRSHACCASRGICSMKRSSYPRARHHRSNGGRLVVVDPPRMRRALTLTGRRPASCAAARPATTSGSGRAS